jgi:hypothetical protein
MAIIRVRIHSNHEDGDSIENTITLNLDDALLGEIEAKNGIDWLDLNDRVRSYPNYANLAKEEVRKNRIEIPDPYFWSTTGIVIGFNDEVIPEDFDFFMVEDKLLTGDFLD